ncbi:RidA family protein [Nonomuraea muscovyensis]|uniref:Reactive intermediate/imine deaminase n=1 Tax=Nonomuraea muscovyensis TaxID=1124761 RepID=A0A7X0EXV8_9ACTN|nr:RidA family protein [Nonomuraea muscovyensis]MBB6345784.1 reactive intermediate/imine deaminase [Nonomuraea muscovyensis]MDF2706780.1 reactive intermediate/imine deaminase [Nonomuraea muscovyensis]
MPKRVIDTPEAAPPGGPYSQAVVAGDYVYLAGACPVRPDGTWVRGSFAEQARQAFTNLAKVAEAAGADLSQAVRVGVYVSDFAHFPELNEIYVEFFGTANLPARTTIPVALSGFDIEIDAVLYTG